jgi:ABC-type sugar transport system permease subunit
VSVAVSPVKPEVMANKKKTTHFERSRERTCFFFVLPAILFVATFLLVPVLMSFVLSLTDYDGVLTTFSNMKFIGLENFRYVITAQRFPSVLWNTVYFCLLCVPVMNALALCLAYFVTNIPIRRGSFYKTILYYPNLIPMLAGGYAWQLIFHYDKGVLNYIAEGLGIGRVDWIGNPGIVMLSLTLVMIWHTVGYYMVIYVAGLISIPVDLYEAADIEGCGTVKKFFKISLPMLASSLTVNVVLSTMAIFTSFGLIYAMTNGGPGYATTSLSIEVFSYAFNRGDIPAGMATGVLLGLFALFIMVFELKFLLKNEEVYNG